MFLSECCTFCTILHITFLSLERYLAVCWPITAKTMVTRHRTRVVIGCLWLGAAVSAAPVLVMVGVEDVGVEDPGLSQWREGGGWTGEFVIGGGETEGAHMALLDAGLDGIQYAISSGLLAAMMILSNLYFLVPLCILGLVYSLIGRTLWLRPKSSRRDQSHRNTVKMHASLLVSFRDDCFGVRPLLAALPCWSNSVIPVSRFWSRQAGSKSGHKSPRSH
uniref:G-protein coupled receptors family 1 profile domain-containing protein n=1 Tax=Nothobranchius kuhntae TaxID=321403 RepID=A0A1A8J1T0_NOTKU